jgi:hypothetical protein
MNNESSAAGLSEVTRLTSAGGGTTAFAAKVESNYLCNVYKVCMVEMLSSGEPPIEIGNEMNAVNLAESFTQPGHLAVGEYVLVFTVGEKNVFYAKP